MSKSTEETPLLSDVSKQGQSITLKEKLLSCRWQIGYVASLTMSCTVLLRLNMSMVVVCMNPPNMTVTIEQNGTNVTLRDTYMDNYVEWDSSMAGLLISGYYIGQVFTSLLFGSMSGRLSGKRVVLYLTSIITVTSVLTPAVTFISPYVVLTTRIIIGIATAGLEPCITQLLSNWAPLHERAQMMSLVETANSLGGIGNFLVAGLICSIPILGGWPFIFYIFGGLNVLALVVWALLVYDKPTYHPRITPKEVYYINRHRSKTTGKPLKIPWVKMLTSPPVWACVLGFITSGTLFMVMAICLPLYIEQVLQFDVTTNGLVSALAFVGRFFGAAFFGYISDWVFSKRWLSISKIRKACHVNGNKENNNEETLNNIKGTNGSNTGLLGSVPLLLWISYLDEEDRTIAVVLITLYWFILTCMNSGFRVNPADIAPRFAGVINGICIFFNSIVSLFVPLLVTSLTENGTAEEWRLVFFGCVGVSVIGAIVFVVLASGEEQEWAKDPDITTDLVIKVTSNNNDAFETDQDIANTKSRDSICTSFRQINRTYT